VPTAADPAFVAYSSGTTGRPQPVVRTHENLWWEAENIATSTAIGSDDTILGVIPLSHAYGLGNALLASLRTGARLILRPRFVRRHTLDLLATHAVSVFPTVPFMARMLATTDRGRRWALDALRLCISAGAPLTLDVYDAFLARFGVPIRQLYGLTEAGDVALNLAPLMELDPTSVGRPIGTVRVTIEDTDGTEVAPGATGEIVVRSDSAMGGAAQPLRTRDQGHWSACGDLVITGRTSLFINSAGNKVNPAEVEVALRSHPAVADVAVFGIPTPHGDQLVAAAVVARESCTAEELRVHCGRLLASYKIPRVVSFRDALPRSPLGKILLGELLDGV
jgi:long-chain acyl-CoA synthetase